MKRLIIALAAAVAVLTVSAKVTVTNSFEESFKDFVPNVENVDESELVPYDNDEPGVEVTAPYNFDGYGLKYLSLDTGDATLWRTNAGDAAYLDMVMQFNPSTETPTVDDSTKISVYLNASSNLVVIAGPKVDTDPTVYVTTSSLDPGVWGRITVSVVEGGFKVFLNGTAIKTSDETDTFPSLTGNNTILAVGFSGSGKLDDFVARTTDPFLQNPAATIGGEGYASLADALADDPTATPQLEADASYSLARGDSVSVKLNNHNLALTVPEGLYAYPTTSEGVTTYTADYFPRTNTPGQDGTAANPYEVADVDDIAALNAAFAADATFRSKNYKLVADIDATDLGYFDGIGTASGTNGNTGLNGGTFDGAGHTIGNVKFTPAKYRGFFNQVLNSTIKDLTINVVDIQQTSAAEHGYAAFAGNMKNSQILNCRATGTLGTTAKPTMHTSAGFAVKVDSAGVFVNCTNEIDIVCSLTDNPKIGGIAGLFQGGALTNCWNSGDITITCKKCNNNGNGAGGLVGYAQTSTLKIHGGGNEGTIQSTDTTPDGGTYDIKVGTIIGMQFSSTATVTGGTVAQADAAPAGAFATISGLTYATVDNNVATFVPDAELAAGNTYVLQQNVAASQTPVFTLTSSGDTIAFDTAKGFTFAGTVAVDRSKLMPATSETVGTVTIYSTTAGVASVDGVAYATFEDAVAALEGETEDDFVTLLADVLNYAVSAGDTLKVKTGSHTFMPIAAPDVILTSTTDEHDVMTFTAVEGVAAIKYDSAAPWVWYDTFERAYAEARATSGNALMKIKITDDFTPAISATYDHFYSLTFEDVREDKSEGLTINLKNSAGTAYMAGSRYYFPDNATLVLAANWTPWTSGLVSGGILEVPSGITVTLLDGANNYLAFDNLEGISGEGRVALASNISQARLNNIIYYYNAPDTKLAQYMRNGRWHGTFELAGTYTNNVFVMSRYASANSSLCFNGFTNTYFEGGTYNIGVELVGDGLTIVGRESDPSSDLTISGALKGTGPLTVTATPSTQYTIKFTGDVSEYAGSITLANSGKARVAFGSEGISGDDNCIAIGSDASVTVAAGKTWTAPNGFVLQGNLVVNGTLVTASDKAIYGGGTVTFTSPTTIPMGWYWAGTYYANFKAANNAPFYIPVHASAKTVINGSNGEFGGYARYGSGAPTVQGEVVLNADWTIGDGYPGTANKTTLAKLSGDGSLTTCTKTVSNTVYYEFTELDNYTNGVITISDGTSVTIGRVNVDTTPANNSRVVKITKVGAGVCNDNVPLYVGGVDTGKTLTYDANGAEGAGLYLVASSPSGFNGGDGATFSIPTETQSDLEAKLPSGKTLADPVAGSASGMTYAQAYALGLMDEDTGAVEDLKATIAVVDGKVTVSLNGDADDNLYTVTLKVYKKASLTAAWPAEPTATYALGAEPEETLSGTAGFYKVEVSISSK